MYPLVPFIQGVKMLYNTWEELELNIVDIKLDPYNPRIKPNLLTERALISEYVCKYDVFELARSIAENGYFRHERIVTVIENDKIIVIEGNRRITALKALLQPNVTPLEVRKKYKHLNSMMTRVPTEVPAIMAPSREEANKIVLHRHMINSTLPWKRTNQTRFIYSMSKNIGIDTLSKEFKIPTSTIFEYIKSYVLYQIAKQMILPPDVKSIVEDDEKFPLTTLDRIMSIPKVREFLGIKFLKNGSLVGSIDIYEFSKGYSKIIVDISRGSITSRSDVLKKGKISSYLHTFGPACPNKNISGTFSEKDFLDEDTYNFINNTSTTKIGEKKQSPSRNQRHLITKKMDVKIDNENIAALYIELSKKINVKQTPYATALLCRSFIHLLIYQYLKDKGHFDTINNCETDKYGDIISYITSDTNSFNNDNILFAIREVLTKHNHTFSFDSPLSFFSDEYTIVSENDIRAAWDSMENIVILLLKGA